MLGYIAVLLFLHTVISTLRWRKFVQSNQEPFFLPIDVSPLKIVDLVGNHHCNIIRLHFDSNSYKEIQSIKRVYSKVEVLVS